MINIYLKTKFNGNEHENGNGSVALKISIVDFLPEEDQYVEIKSFNLVSNIRNTRRSRLGLIAMTKALEYIQENEELLKELADPIITLHTEGDDYYICNTMGKHLKKWIKEDLKDHNGPRHNYDLLTQLVDVINKYDYDLDEIQSFHLNDFQFTKFDIAQMESLNSFLNNNGFPSCYEDFVIFYKPVLITSLKEIEEVKEEVENKQISVKDETSQEIETQSRTEFDELRFLLDKELELSRQLKQVQEKIKSKLK